MASQYGEVLKGAWSIDDDDFSSDGLLRMALQDTWDGIDRIDIGDVKVFSYRGVPRYLICVEISICDDEVTFRDRWFL